MPVQFEADVRGKRRKLIAIANRNAFYYVLDRATGEFVAGRAYAKQTWSQRIWTIRAVRWCSAEHRAEPSKEPRSGPT